MCSVYSAEVVQGMENDLPLQEAEVMQQKVDVNHLVGFLKSLKEIYGPQAMTNNALLS